MLENGSCSFVLSFHLLHHFAHVGHTGVDMIDPVELGVIPDLLQGLLGVHLPHRELSEASSGHLLRGMEYPCVFIQRGAYLTKDPSHHSVQLAVANCLNENNLVLAHQHRHACDHSVDDWFVI